MVEKTSRNRFVSKNNRIRTNVLDSEYQQKLRDLLHGHLIDNPMTGGQLSRATGIGIITLKNFLNNGNPLLAKQAYILTSYLKNHYLNEFDNEETRISL